MGASELQRQQQHQASLRASDAAARAGPCSADGAASKAAPPVLLHRPPCPQARTTAACGAGSVQMSPSLWRRRRSAGWSRCLRQTWRCGGGEGRDGGGRGALLRERDEVQWSWWAEAAALGASSLRIVPGWVSRVLELQGGTCLGSRRHAVPEPSSEAVNIRRAVPPGAGRGGPRPAAAGGRRRRGGGRGGGGWRGGARGAAHTGDRDGCRLYRRGPGYGGS